MQCQYFDDFVLQDTVLRTETPTSRSLRLDVLSSPSPLPSSDQSSSTAQLDSSSTLTPVFVTTQPRSTAMCKHLHNDLFYRQLFIIAHLKTRC